MRIPRIRKRRADADYQARRNILARSREKALSRFNQLPLPGVYTGLLIALLAALIVGPFIAPRAPVTMAVILSIIALTGINAVFRVESGKEERKRKIRNRIVKTLGVTLAATSVLGRLALEIYPGRLAGSAAALSWALFLGLVCVTMLRQVMKTRQVTSDTIAASICVYLMAGFIWAFIYALIEIAIPGSFKFPDNLDLLPAKPGFMRIHQFLVFLYYSFVTLSTIGYGDMTPVSPPARSFSALEGIAGQLYLAILVARLVGMRISDVDHRSGS